MALSFEPKTEKQLAEERIAPEGEYPFEVLESLPYTSAAGKESIKLKLGIYNGEAMRWQVTDYLTAAFESKLRHFCDAAGLLAKYEAGNLSAEDCRGRAGQCKLGIEKDENGKYPDKNKVKDYVLRKAKPLAAAATAAQVAALTAEESDIPF